jgi:hypothetical protein
LALTWWSYCVTLLESYSIHEDLIVTSSWKGGVPMKVIKIRKAGPVRLTSAACHVYPVRA